MGFWGAFRGTWGARRGEGCLRAGTRGSDGGGSDLGHLGLQTPRL